MERPRFPKRSSPISWEQMATRRVMGTYIWHDETFPGLSAPSPALGPFCLRFLLSTNRHSWNFEPEVVFLRA